MQWNMRDAKNQLSMLVEAARVGEDVVIAKNGVPVVRLVKVGSPDSRRKPGAWGNLPVAASDWDSSPTNAALADALTARKF